MSASNNDEDSYYSELIEIEGDRYLVHSMYGENWPEDDEAILVHQPLDSLLEPQEIILQREIEGGYE